MNVSDDFNSVAAALFTDPKAYTNLDTWHSVAARLRREEPVHRVTAPGFDPLWAVTRHADVIEVERHPAIFLNTVNSVLFPIAVMEANRRGEASVKTLINMDGDEHRAYRAVTNDWFKPASLRSTFEPRINELARQFVDRMEDLGNECDFASEIARFYPLRVIMSILGVPETDEPRMLFLTQKLFGAEDPDFSGQSDAQTARRTAVLDFIEYFKKMTEDRRARPTGDLASVIANGRIEGKPLGHLQTSGYYVIVATAGHDTTSSTLAGGLEVLIRNPDQLQLLQRNPDLLDNAVEEMVRWVSPVRHFLRHATEDYVLGGKQIRNGDTLLLSYLSANRDEKVFIDPFRFDVKRSNAHEHLAFGVGVHFCLGANLARMELKSFFRELLPRLESIELTGPTSYTASTFVGAPKRIPIRYRLQPSS